MLVICCGLYFLPSRISLHVHMRISCINACRSLSVSVALLLLLLTLLFVAGMRAAGITCI
jgi:hypothetical protein